MIDDDTRPIPPIEIVPTLSIGTRPIDWEAIVNALHILEQSLATASLAHRTLLAWLGQEEQSVARLPAAKEQMV